MVEQTRTAIPAPIAEALESARWRLRLAYYEGWPKRVAETLEEIDRLLDEVNGQGAAHEHQIIRR